MSRLSTAALAVSQQNMGTEHSRTWAQAWTVTTVRGSAGHVTAEHGHRPRLSRQHGRDGAGRVTAGNGHSPGLSRLVTALLALSQQNQGRPKLSQLHDHDSAGSVTAEHGHRPGLSRLSTVVLALTQQNRVTEYSRALSQA